MSDDAEHITNYIALLRMITSTTANIAIWKSIDSNINYDSDDDRVEIQIKETYKDMLDKWDLICKVNENLREEMLGLKGRIRDWLNQKNRKMINWQIGKPNWMKLRRRW